MITAPARSAEQRREALDYANRVRYQRAELKRVLKREPWIARHCIDQPAPWLETMRVEDLLCALPHVGPMLVNRWFTTAGVSWRRTLGGLTPRQRVALTRVVFTYLDERIHEQRVSQRDRRRRARRTAA